MYFCFVFVLLFVFCKYYAVVTQQIHASKCHIVCQCMDTSYCILALKHEVKTVVLFLLLFIIQQAVLKKIKWKWNKFYVFSKLFTQAWLTFLFIELDNSKVRRLEIQNCVYVHGHPTNSHSEPGKHSWKHKWYTT